MCQTTSSFTILNGKLGKALKLSQLHVVASPNACIGCGKCDTVCPMRLNVEAQVKSVRIADMECIQCAACCDVCPKTFLIFGFSISTHAVVILLECGVEGSNGSLEVNLIDYAHDDEND